MKAHEETWTFDESYHVNAGAEERLEVWGDRDVALLASAAPDMARVLLAVEWKGPEWTAGPVTPSCPACGGRPPEECVRWPDVPPSEIGHAADCILDAAIRKAGLR